MKTLLLIRHAKSSWAQPSQKDFDRPLNDRGHADAPMMAQRLSDKKIKIDAFVSSPAKRAFTTAKYFAAAYGKKESEIIINDDLYLPSVSSIYSVIKSINDTFENVAIFSHNNGITEFANDLTPVTIDNMPTCSIFAVHIKIDRWKDFEKEEKAWWFFDAPKINR